MILSANGLGAHPVMRPSVPRSRCCGPSASSRPGGHVGISDESSLPSDEFFFPGVYPHGGPAYAGSCYGSLDCSPFATAWAGLANLFYWIDRDNGFGGYWATQILPFADGPSFTSFVDFETAAYKAVTNG